MRFGTDKEFLSRPDEISSDGEGQEGERISRKSERNNRHEKNIGHTHVGFFGRSIFSPEPSWGKWVGEGNPGGCKARVTLKR